MKKETPRENSITLSTKEKKAYHKPALKKFGSVAALTMSGASGTYESGPAPYCGNGSPGKRKSCL